jgi:hypothetical protein
MTKVGSLLENVSTVIEQKIDRLVAVQDAQLAAATGATAPAPQLAAAGLSESIDRAAARIDSSASAMTKVGSLLENVSTVIEQKIDKLVAAQQAGGAGNGQMSQESLQDVAAATRAAREALDAVAALSQQLRSEAPRLAAQPDMVSADLHGWAQRVNALYRLSIESTRELPPLDAPAMPSGVALHDGTEDNPEHDSTVGDTPRPLS